jgi:hypothetical protein
MPVAAWAASLVVAEAIAATLARGAAENEEEGAAAEAEAEAEAGAETAAEAGVEAAAEAAPSRDRYDEAAVTAALARASYRLSEKGALDASAAAYESACARLRPEITLRDCARLRSAEASAGVAETLVEDTLNDLPNLDLLAEFEASPLTLAMASVAEEAAEKAAAEEAAAEKAAAQAAVRDLCAQAERLLTRLKDKQLEEQRQATEEMVDDFLNDVIARASALQLVDEAISAAAVTSMQCDEIYFRSMGALGAAMMIRGRDSVYGEQLEKFKGEIGDVIEKNGRPRMVFEAMVLAKPVLTYTKDPITGKPTFHDKITGLPGEVVLSDEKDNLTFNASNALDSGFSKGTADTPEELAPLLGLKEWYEISDYGVKISAAWNKL